MLLQVIMNLKYARKQTVYPESQCIFLDEDENAITECLFNSCLPLCDLYGNFYVYNGEQNKVLEVHAKRARYSNKQILNMMQRVLGRSFLTNVGMKQPNQIYLVNREK